MTDDRSPTIIMFASEDCLARALPAVYPFTAEHAH